MTAVPGAARRGRHTSAGPPPLAGRRVLVVRPAGRADELVSVLRDAGAEPIHVPLIATVPMTESPALRAAIADLAAGRYDWVAFTSAAAVHALRATAHGAGLTPRIANGTRVAAVGAATAEALRQAGMPVQLLPEGPGSAAALAAAWPVDPEGTTVLLPSSDRAAPTLLEALRATGHRVTTVDAYRTELLPVPDDLADDLAQGRIDAVLLTSPSTAQAIAAVPVAPGTRLVAIGQPTASAARDAGLPIAEVADEPSAHGLIDALARDVAAPNAPPKKEAVMPFPVDRPRRLRRTPMLRRLVAETRLSPAELILPMFVREGIDEPQPIASMPGVVQHTLDTLRAAATDAMDAGVGGLMIFGVPARRDAVGSGATDPGGILATAIAALHTDLGDGAVLMADLCLDEFTDHGHCGVLATDGSVDNDATLLRYADMGVALAEAGAHLVGTSGMMDGQVAAVRAALDRAGHIHTGIIGYAAKYASACYGPFREAVDSQLVGDRRTYQMDPANGREALREVDLDIAEGADIVIVKPAGWYLDVLAAAAARSTVPVAAYQVSGEYAMITAAAQKGWIDRDAAVIESLLGIRRAGADVILTYWAAEVAAGLAAGRI